MKNMKKLILIVSAVVLFSAPLSAATITRIVSHPSTVQFLDYGSALGYAYFDALTDAGIWQTISGVNNGKTYSSKAGLERFHYNKNMANLCLIVKGYSVGMQLWRCMSGRMSWSRFIGRQVCQLFLDNFIWHLTYNYSRYGYGMPVRAEYNGSRYVIPFPGRDIRIGLSGNQVRVANAVEIAVGVIPLFTFDFPLN